MRPTLASTLAMALAITLPLAWLSAHTQDAAAAVGRPGVSSGGATLVLDGDSVASLRSVDGGAAVAEVVDEPAARGTAPKKHVAGVKYEDLSLEIDLGQGRLVYDWIGAALRSAATPKNGSVVFLDMNRTPRETREFQNAVISQTTFPALDAASKEPGTLRFSLAVDRVTTGSGAAKASPTVGAKSKLWLSSNFRLEIDGLDSSRVSRIEPIFVKHTPRLAIENLQITLAETGADSWRRWQDDFLGKGGDKLEKNGRIVFLGPTLKEELAELRLEGLGLVALRARSSENALPTLQAELYVERLAFATEPGAK